MLLTEEPFEGFCLTGAEWNNGYTFLADNNKDIYFEAGDARVGANGAISSNGTNGLYWQSVPTLKDRGKPSYGLRTSLKNGSINTFPLLQMTPLTTMVLMLMHTVFIQ